jgi:tetratricopeptide (TPR) repeat protein
MEKTTESAHNFFEMGLRLLQADDCRNAISMLSIAIDVDPYFAEAYQFRGIAYFSLHSYQRALDDYQTALSLDPSLDKAYFFRALYFIHFKLYGEAIKDLTSAIELDKYFAEAFFYQGICKGLLDDEKGGTYDIKAAASLGMPEAQKKLNEKGIVW